MKNTFDISVTKVKKQCETLKNTNENLKKVSLSIINEFVDLVYTRNPFLGVFSVSHYLRGLNENFEYEFDIVLKVFEDYDDLEVDNEDIKITFKSIFGNNGLTMVANVFSTDVSEYNVYVFNFIDMNNIRVTMPSVAKDDYININFKDVLNVLMWEDVFHGSNK